MVVYCDDILIIAPSVELSLAWTRQVIVDLQRHGFWVKLPKSALKPSTRCQFLGFILDSETMTVHLPRKKRKDARKLARSWLSRRLLSGRDLSRLVGVLLSLSPAIPYGRAHVRALEAILRPVAKRHEWWRRVQLTREAADCLSWWVRTLKSHRPRHILVNVMPDLEVELDASGRALGAEIPRIGLSIVKPYKGDQGSRLSSNFRELSNVPLVMRILEKRGFDSLLPERCSSLPLHIRFHVDNTTSEAYVNNEGGRWPALNRLALKALDIAERNQVVISASYLRGEFQWMADAASRLQVRRHDYRLHPQARELVFSSLGRPSIDLFATPESAVVERFVSWLPHPKATFSDAMSINWGTLSGTLYAFPPIGMVLTVLMKMIMDRTARLILITPLWESAPWWPLLERVTMRRIVLPAGSKSLMSGDSPLTRKPLIQSCMTASLCSWTACEKEAELWSRLRNF